MTSIARALVFRTSAPLLAVLHRIGVCSCLLALRGFESLRWHLGRLGAWVRLEDARRAVPAYRDFLARRSWRADQPFDDLPVTDKANYVKEYSLDARCSGGRLPVAGITIDESSGSTGMPTNWVRGPRERDANRRTIRAGLERRFGKGPLFFINAFALGPWATGINLTLSLSSWCRVKSLGPDLAKIGNTLEQFGPDHHYVIMGYPPFLKQVVDQLGVDWTKYRVSMVYGGEAMSESMRRYIQSRGIARVYGSYGASDLELNIAAETDFTIIVRRLLEQRPDFRARVLRRNGVLPMVFQYNPADFFIESSAEGELLVTVCRPGYIAPKVRYNIHDLGEVMRFPEIVAHLRDVGIDASTLDANALDLPLMFLYGRADSTVAYYGSKVSPADVQEALFRLPELAAAVDAFQLETSEDAAGDKRLVVHLEITSSLFRGKAASWGPRFFATLAQVNQDFREAARMVPDGKEPSLALHEHGAGPFTGADVRIKRRYIAA